MLRTCTIIVLMWATLLGPCLCCCAAATFFTPTTEPTSTAPLKVTLPTSEPDEFACPYCRQAKPTPTLEPSAPTQPSPAKPSHDCPCCAERGTPSAIAEVPTPFVIEMAVFTVLPVDPAPALPLPTTSTVVVDPPGFGITHFLIDHCHRLRC